MTNKLFGKIFLITVLFAMLVAGGIKLYSTSTFPQIEDWNYNQLQNINHSKTNFSFAVFGDNKNSINTFDTLIQKLNNQDILFSIDIGDLVFDGAKEKYRFFLNQIKNCQKPFLTVIGNHGIKENGLGNYVKLFGRPYYSFSVGQSYFIILDDSNEKDLDTWQYSWLVNELNISQKYKYRFVFMHVPLYDPRAGNYSKWHSLSNLTFAKKLNNLFDENNVTLLFVSHIHAFFQGTWGKTPYIITGGAGAELAGNDPEHYFYHYIKVYVSDSKVSYQVIKLKNPLLGVFGMMFHNFWIYFYSFVVLHFLDIILYLGTLYVFIYIVFFKKRWLYLNVKKRRK